MSFPFGEPDVWQITSTGEWLTRRRGLVTASRVGALFANTHPFYDDIEELANEIHGQSIKGESAAMRAGLLLEAIFPAAIAEVHPEWRVVKANTFHTLPNLRLGCTPDFWIYVDGRRAPAGLIQAKTINPRDWERQQGRPALYWTLQTLTELIVTGVERGVLAVIVRNSTLPLYLFDVPRHPAAENRILAAVADFWARVDRGELPVTTPKDEIEALLDDGSFIDLSENNYLCEALPRREQLKAEVSLAEKQIGEIDDALKIAMGAASTAHLPGYNISYRSQHRKESIIPARDIRVLRVKAAQDEC